MKRRSNTGSTASTGFIILVLFMLVLFTNQGVIQKTVWAEPQASVASPGPQASQLTKPEASFFILSDLHIARGTSTPSTHLKQALADIESFGKQAQAIILTGDITDSATVAEYAELQRILSSYKLPPVYASMGNHDYYSVWINEKGAWSQGTFPNGKTDAGSRQTFMSVFDLEKPYSDVWLNGTHIILLSQETYIQEQPKVGEGAWYSDEQLEWLRSHLAKSPKGKPVFVMIHQELPPNGMDGGSHTLIRARQFRDILRPYPNVFVVSGHTHQDFKGSTQHYIQETFHWFKNSSAGQVLNETDQPVRESAAQGLYVQVYKDKVILRGREFSSQTWIDEAQWTVPLAK
jgi:3',5'-cyclic-AMP phosphodiesterase